MAQDAGTGYPPCHGIYQRVLCPHLHRPEGRFAEWAGSLLPFDKPMILVTEPGKEEESATASRVGF